MAGGGTEEMSRCLRTEKILEESLVSEEMGPLKTGSQWSVLRMGVMWLNYPTLIRDVLSVLECSYK